MESSRAGRSWSEMVQAGGAARAAAPPPGASFAIRTPADAFVWKLARASACFAPFAVRGAFPFDFANVTRAAKSSLFAMLVSQFDASGFLKSPEALDAVKTHLPIFATARDVGDGDGASEAPRARLRAADDPEDDAPYTT